MTLAIKYKSGQKTQKYYVNINQCHTLYVYLVNNSRPNVVCQSDEESGECKESQEGWIPVPDQ